MNGRYRLWNKEKKRWHDGYHIHFAPNGQLYYEGMNITDRYDIVFWTGLKNEEGNDLYYGDIIESVSYPRTNMVIRWSNEPEWHGYYCHDISDDVDTHLNMYEAIRSKKVGNIFENPELVGEL